MNFQFSPVFCFPVFTHSRNVFSLVSFFCLDHFWWLRSFRFDSFVLAFYVLVYTVEKYTYCLLYFSSLDCTFTSTNRFKLKEHCRTHTHEKSFSCPNCGGLFSNKTKFTDHLRRQNTMESEYCTGACSCIRVNLLL